MLMRSGRSFALALESPACRTCRDSMYTVERSVPQMHRNMDIIILPFCVALSWIRCGSARGAPTGSDPMYMVGRNVPKINWYCMSLVSNSLNVIEMRKVMVIG